MQSERTKRLAAVLALGLTGCVSEPAAAFPPLHVAARHGNVEAIQALLKQGAAVDQRHGSNAWTPLQHAVHKRQKAAVLALLRAGADANGSDGYPLVMAAGYGDTEIVRALLAHRADPMRYPRPRAQSALWAAVGGGAILDITDGPPFGSCFPDVVKVLVERAPSLELVEDAPMTRLVRFLGRSDACTEAFATIERGRAARTAAGRS
jgi:ankyrin repeat protein